MKRPQLDTVDSRGGAGRLTDEEATTANRTARQKYRAAPRSRWGVPVRALYLKSADVQSATFLFKEAENRLGKNRGSGS